jgi:CBS domain-containing protein
MEIKAVMTPHAEVISPEATLTEAAQKMRGWDLGLLPVWDGGQLVGVLTDRDVVVQALALGYDPRATPVRLAMTPECVCCYEDQDVRQAAALMQERQVRRLVVLDREQQLVGVVSLGDLAVGTGDRHLADAALEEVSAPDA